MRSRASSHGNDLYGRTKYQQARCFKGGIRGSSTQNAIELSSDDEHPEPPPRSWALPSVRPRSPSHSRSLLPSVRPRSPLASVRRRSPLRPRSPPRSRSRSRSRSRPRSRSPTPSRALPSSTHPGPSRPRPSLPANVPRRAPAGGLLSAEELQRRATKRHDAQVSAADRAAREMMLDHREEATPDAWLQNLTAQQRRLFFDTSPHIQEVDSEDEDDPDVLRRRAIRMHVAGLDPSDRRRFYETS